MATARQLAHDDVLIDLSTALENEALPLRCMYAYPAFGEWYEHELPKIEKDIKGGGTISPTEQVDILIERFLLGRPFGLEQKSRNLHPRSKGVWELKTNDIRLFGWFWRPDVYILYRAVDATWVKDSNAYSGFVLETEYHRDRLDLDEPKFHPGGYNDVFQV